VRTIHGQDPNETTLLRDRRCRAEDQQIDAIVIDDSGLPVVIERDAGLALTRRIGPVSSVFSVTCEGIN